MNKFFSLLLVISFFSCSNNKKDKTIDTPKIIEKTELKKSIKKIDSEKKTEPILEEIVFNEIEKEIIEVATSFHKWYIKNGNDLKSEISTGIEIEKGKNGKCKVNYQPYFNELRKLNTISEKFIENEKNRTKVCADYIQQIAYEVYEKSEGYDYDEYCDFFYYQYWTRAQDTFDGLKVFQINKKDNFWEVIIQFYTIGDNKKYYSTDNIPIIKVELELNKYMITEINWKEN